MPPHLLIQPICPTRLVKHPPAARAAHNDELEGPVAQAERVRCVAQHHRATAGTAGQRFNWRSSFFIGLTAAAGVVVTVGFVEMFLVAAQTLLLIGMGLFPWPSASNRPVPG